MSCSRNSEERLSAYVDGELGPFARWRMDAHLRGCADCAARVQALRGLSERLRREVPRHAAPDALRERLRAQLGAPAPAPRTRTGARPWTWLAGGALAGSAATIVAILAGTLLLRQAGSDDLVAEAVKDHVQAALQDRRIEVASSDQHTVKPWLSARLDYSPPVRDFASEGYTLVGGRLEVLGGERVATLVYQYRLHMIDVFVRPAPARAPGSARSLRGFNVVHATGGDMDYLAVSDLNTAELGAFVERVAKASAAAP
jgi:anti-sigma factor RsiW